MSVLSAVMAGNISGERVAVLCDGRPPLRWDELARLAGELTAALRRFGVGPADRVGVLMPDGPDMALCALATTEAGICVQLNPGYPPGELKELFGLTGIRFLLVQGAPDEVLQGARDLGIAVLTLRGGDWAPRLEGPAAAVASEAVLRGNRETALLLLTSGSTAKPKLVPLSHGNLVAALGNLVRSLQLTADDRCLNMMPMFHIGGLVDLFLAPLSVGGSVVCAPRISAAAFYACLERDAPTWFQAVPTVLREVLTHGETHGLDLATSLRFIRSVSAPLPPMLLSAVEAAFSVPVIEIFGMTETSGLIASNPLPPGKRKQGSVGIAAGPEMAIIDEAGNRAAAGRNGEIIIRGETVTAGYLNAELRRGDFFIGDWLRTGDEGHLDAEGYLFLTGRIKEIINRGGEKISPRQIDDVVAEIAGIAEAAAYAIPHPSLGEEVALAVVLKPGAAVTGEQIAAHLAPHLAAFKIPKVVTFLEALPRVPSGKLDRKAIPASVEQLRSRAQEAPFAMPQTPMQKLIASLWQRTLGMERVGLDDNFFELGGDSLTATTFIIELEAALRRTLPPAMLFEAPTVRAFERALAAMEASGAAPAAAGARALPPAIYHRVRQSVAGWKGSRHHPDALIVGRNTLGALPPLFWGSTAEGEFTLLAGALDENRPLYSLRSLSYMKGKTEANTRLLGAHYAEEIDAIQPEGPILIGGFCDGGNVAFHAAKALLAKGRQIGALLLQNRFVAEPFAPPVSLFWSRTRWLNAHDLSIAERGWNRFYSGPLSVQSLPFEHAHIYTEKNIGRFAAQLEAELKRIEAGEPPAHTRSFPLARPLAPDAYQARVSARAPVLVRPGAEIRVPVSIRNDGEVVWLPTPESGIAVSASWRNFDGYPRVDLDGYAPLAGPVAPGGILQTSLTLHVPRTSMPMMLAIDLLEEGVGWFAERGGRASKTIVLPLPALLPVTG